MAHQSRDSGLSVVGTEGALRAARYHRDRALTPGLVEYWDRVISGLEKKLSLAS